MQVQRNQSTLCIMQSKNRKAPHLTKEILVNEYPDRFEGLGAFKDMKPYHITLDSAAQPVVHPPRQVPVHL